MPDEVIPIGPVQAGKSIQGRLVEHQERGRLWSGTFGPRGSGIVERVRQALLPYPNVVLLLPSPDAEEAVRVSKERKGDLTPYENDFDVLYVTHPSNRAPAKHVVYAEGKSPEGTRHEILQRQRLSP